jgi:hypothetical protein
MTPRQATCGHDTDDILRYGTCTGLLFPPRLPPHLTMSTLWFVDGVPSGSVPQLGADSPWARWGDGIYDTFRIEHGVAVDLDLHLDRVVRACATSAMPAPSPEWLRDHVLSVCAHVSRSEERRVGKECW